MFEAAPSAKGRVRGCCRDDNGRFHVTPWKSNLILYQWGSIICRLTTMGQPQYRISGMYLEYANVGSPSDPVTAPTFDRTDASAYYASLSGSSDLDYLRVPLVSAVIDTNDPTNAPLGNLSRFMALSVGTAGVWGKPFAAGNNSKLYGAALVAIVDQGDSSQDLILSRFYWDTDDQFVKTNSQIGVEWEVAWQ